MKTKPFHFLPFAVELCAWAALCFGIMRLSRDFEDTADHVVKLKLEVLALTTQLDSCRTANRLMFTTHAVKNCEGGLP